MKNILCYGDSNTWGYRPDNGKRYSVDARWPGALQQLLGEDYRVVEEGLCGRTTVFEDPVQEGRSGKDYLKVCLDSHAPLDMVIVMLGTNDFKSRFAAPAQVIARGAGILGEIVTKSGFGIDGKAPKLLLVAPPEILAAGPWSHEFAGEIEKSREYPGFLQMEAEQMGAFFFNAGSVAASSPVDGIHLEEMDNRKLVDALALQVRAILK